MNENVNAVENNVVAAEAAVVVTVEAAIAAVKAAKTPADVVRATEAALAVCKEKRDVKAARKLSASTYGIWHGEEATASELVSWCDNRLGELTKWTENVLALKASAQSKLTEGMTLKERLLGVTPEQLKAYLDGLN